MKFNLWARVVVIALMPKLAIAQSVETHTQVIDLGDALPSFEYVTFPAFDPDLGELTGVTWQLDAVFEGEAVYTCESPPGGGCPAGCTTGYAANMLIQAWNPGGEYLQTGVLPLEQLASPDNGGVQTWQGFHTDTVSVDPSPIFEGAGVSFFIAQTGQTHFWPSSCSIDAEVTRSGWDAIVTLTYAYLPSGGCDNCADVDGSGVVDVLDFIAVVMAFGTCPPGPCPVDINCDGVVDVLDLLEMVIAWQTGATC